MNAKIVILTGAGISAASGLATFRGSNGLWNGHSVDDVATLRGFRKNPNVVNQFYNELRSEVANAQPNDAHIAIAEHQKNKDIFLVTQNVDHLHEKAGSNQCLHMHGSMFKAQCLRNPNHTIDIYRNIDDSVRCNECNSRMRPAIVWFGEPIIGGTQIYRSLKTCTHLISVGTSGIVHPAAGFVDIDKTVGAKCIRIDLEKCDNPAWDDEIVGDCVVEMRKLLENL